MDLHVGFTGSSDGLSPAQVSALTLVCQTIDQSHPGKIIAHHGDCIEGDQTFHDIARSLGWWIVGHPPINSYKRAFCQFDEVRALGEYLVRNKAIVSESVRMIACPKGLLEELRSGTWSTIRYTRKLGRPLQIVYPDGQIVKERL